MQREVCSKVAFCYRDDANDSTGRVFTIRCVRTDERAAGNFITSFTANSRNSNGSRHLAGAFGFYSLLDVHLDQLGFGFRLLSQSYLQHTLFIVGAYLL